MRSQRREKGAESAKSRRRGRARLDSRGSSYILGRCDNDQLLAEPTNGAGIAVSSADVGRDTNLRRWSAERAPKDHMNDGARVRAGAGSRELHIGQVPAQLARTTPKIERVRTIFRRDLHQLILGWPGPITAKRITTHIRADLPEHDAIKHFLRRSRQPEHRRRKSEV